ncbi:MAG: outer membrane protein assembly factor BamB [Cellvibrionaceae bacterium]
MKKFLLAVLHVVSAIILVACASTDENTEPMELEKFEAKVNLQKEWSRNIGKGQDERYTLLTPAIVGDNIYASDIKGTVFAIERKTGDILWKVKLKEPVSSGVTATTNTLFLGTYNADVIALDIEDGSIRWKSRVSSEVLSAPQSNGEIVAVQTYDGKITGLDHKAGEQQWLYESAPPTLTLRGDAAPYINSSTVYAGFATGKVVALESSDGLLSWEQRVAIPKGRGEFEKLVDIDAAPLMVGEILFVASYQGQLLALSRATGRPLWNKPISTYSNLASAGGKVFVNENDGSIKAFRVGNGVEVWKNNQLLRRKLTAPEAFDDYVAVADDEDGYLHLLDSDTGTFAARIKVDGSGVRSPLVSKNDLLYVFSNDGKLVAYSVQDID